MVQRVFAFAVAAYLKEDGRQMASLMKQPDQKWFKMLKNEEVWVLSLPDGLLRGLAKAHMQNLAGNFVKKSPAIEAEVSPVPEKAPDAFNDMLLYNTAYCSMERESQFDEASAFGPGPDKEVVPPSRSSDQDLLDHLEFEQKVREVLFEQALDQPQDK